jgi:hypothetical protein
MMNWWQKNWQKIGIFVASLMLLLLLLLSFFGLQVYRQGRELIQSLQSPAQVDTKITASLNSNLDNLFTVLKLPVIHQITKVLDLDFSPIKSDIQTIISASASLAGDDGAKQYLVAFQNTAEARGPGGILGAYALLEIKNGKLAILKTGSNAGLQHNGEIPIKMPAEFMRVYGKNPAIWQNSNLSPHFPYGAMIWKATWEQQFGGNLDGVIAIDPTAISYILNATGEITLRSGEKINSQNVVEQTLSKAYKDYEKDNNARKEYLVQIMNATFTKLLANDFNKVKMARAIKHAVIENRLLIYSVDKKVQTALEKSKLGGALQVIPNNEYRVVIQNIDASKLDYYLDRQILVESKSCSVPKQTQVVATVTNNVTNASDLPAYVLTRADKNKPRALITGQHRFKVFIYGPVDGKLISASRSTPGAELGGGATERARPLYTTDVDLAPNQSETILANFEGGSGKISYIDQPLVRKTQIIIKDKC